MTCVYEELYKKLNGSIDTHAASIFKESNVAKDLSCLHDKYAVVLADKASNNIVVVRKTHYINCMIN